MTEIAEKYLGNIKENSVLEERIKVALESHKYLEVYLQESDRGKGRILTRATSGEAIGIIKSRDFLLSEGDVLETALGNLLLIKLKVEQLMILSFNQPQNQNISPLDLIRLGHILGNHHYPIKVENNKVYVRVVSNPKVLQKRLEELNVSGLNISFETKEKYPLFDCDHSHY